MMKEMKGVRLLISETGTEGAWWAMQEGKLVALSTPETRRALSPTALRGFFHVVLEWSLDDNQMRGLLGGIAP